MTKRKLSEAQLAALAKGRKIGASAGGRAVARKPAPEDCGHCRMMGYTSWMQHLGHLAARKLLQDHPTAISHVFQIIRARNNAGH